MSVSFDFVTFRLATGSAIQSKEDVDLLVASGITDVINCREDDESQFLSTHPGIIRFLHNPTEDDGSIKSPEWFRKSIVFGLETLSIRKRKLFCHCQVGCNRGPSTTYAILRAFGLNRIESLAMIRLARPITIAGIRYADDADVAVKQLGYE